MEKNQSTILKKGFKRLSLIFGGLGAVIWGFLCFMDIIELSYPRDEKVIIGLLFSFFIPWGILRAIPWVIEGFKEKRVNEKESQATHKDDFPTEAFPIDTPSHYHPQFNSMGVRLNTIDKKLKRIILYGIIFTFSLFMTSTLISLLSENQKVLKAQSLSISDRFGNSRIVINNGYKSNKPSISFLNDKGEVVSTIDETGLWLTVQPKPGEFIPDKPNFIPIPKTK